VPLIGVYSFAEETEEADWRIEGILTITDTARRQHCFQKFFVIYLKPRKELISEERKEIQKR
jgi:hypothetical protein